MSKAEQYELAIALALLGIFGAPLFQNFLNGQFEYREQLSLAFIMVLVSIYMLLRMYIAYRKSNPSAQEQSAVNEQLNVSQAKAEAKQLLFEHFQQTNAKKHLKALQTLSDEGLSNDEIRMFQAQIMTEVENARKTNQQISGQQNP
jgi:hypothetical protein